ncbi:phage tail assembly chaperone [Pontixanthobacter luteolus]|nr:phage tail assembly chaperone [Pontixanthobacter luteolus]
MNGSEPAPMPVSVPAQTGLFSQSASALAGIAARALGWRPDEFWNATPADLVLALSDPQSSSETITRTELNHLLEQERNG